VYHFLDAPPHVDDVESKVGLLVRLVNVACDVALPPRNPPLSGRNPVYWENENIAVALVKCVRQRRKVTGLCVRDVSVARITMKIDFWSARKEQMCRIRRSNAKCWIELVRNVDADL